MDIAYTEASATFLDEIIIEYDVDLFIVSAGVSNISEIPFWIKQRKFLKSVPKDAITGINAAYTALKKRGHGG
jgi:hypothetical protein